MSANQKSGASGPSERRTDARHSARIDAVLDDPSHASLGFTASGFSRTGAFLKRRDNTTPLPAVGTAIHLVFRWPMETKIPPVHVEAKVIRQTEDGVGVQFD